MTPEDRKDYNQKYYEKKKDKIKALNYAAKLHVHYAAAK